jgi:ABC-type multidrug transport system ATPase subunit
MSVEVQGLTRVVRARKLLDGVSFAFSGGLFVVLGPPRAGKSELLKLLAALAAPTSGSITLFGEDLATERRKLQPRIVLIPAGATAPDRFTVREALEYSALLHGLTQAPVRNVRIHSALERLGLRDLEAAPIETLPLGVRRRVAIGQALVAAPVLLLLDEPARDLHPSEATEITMVLQRLSSELPIVVATQSPAEASALAGGLLILDRGRGLFHGPVPALLASFHGRVWAAHAGWEEPPPSLNGAVPTGILCTPGGRVLRAVAPAQPGPNAQQVLPLLEDAYAVLLACPPG